MPAQPLLDLSARIRAAADAQQRIAEAARQAAADARREAERAAEAAETTPASERSGGTSGQTTKS